MDAEAQAPTIGGNAWKYTVLLLLVAAMAEAAAFVACKVLAQRRLFYIPAKPTGYARYMAERDPVLGWPSPRTFGRGEYDASGSRIVPAFPDPAAKQCVALFGDSFTFSEEVSPEDSYANVLAKALGCRVANYGVGGYGTDQALLRYEALQPSAPVVVLGHYTEDIIRNVNRERGFMNSEMWGLKPRFVLSGGALELLPLPSLSEEQYAALPDRASTLLPDDYFVPGGPSGIVTLRFPFILSLVRLFGNYRIQSHLRGEPSHLQFYRADHPSGALDVTTAIMERFARTARERGQTPLVLMIPDVKDFEWLRAHGVPTYQPLVDRLKARNVPVVSATEPLDAYLGARSPCDLYSRCSGAHLRPEGYLQLAKVVERAIRERGLPAAPIHP